MKSEQGSALIVALVVVLIVVGISGAFLVDTAFRSKHASAARESDEAQMICEAALEKTRRALYVYKTDDTYPWDRILADHAGLSTDFVDHWADYVARRDDEDFASYGATYYQAGASTQDDAPLPEDPGHFLGVSKPFSQGAFYVVIRDNDDGDGDEFTDSDYQILVYVTASLPDGTQRQIEALVYWENPKYTPGSGILVDGNVRFSGTTDVRGELGRVHANGTIDLNGGPTFSVSANATGEIDEGSSPIPPEGFNEFVSPVEIPFVDPEDYRDQATYILRADGTVEVVATGQVVRSGNFDGWRFEGGSWSFTSSRVAPAGCYYVEGNAKLTGSGNTPYQTMTVIATGSIETGGNVKFAPYLENTLFLAAGDISMAGTSGSVFEGVVAANEQVRTQGTFDLQGSMIAKNASNNHRLLNSIDFGGDISVTYDGGMPTIIENPIRAVPIRAMKRLK